MIAALRVLAPCAPLPDAKAATRVAFTCRDGDDPVLTVTITRRPGRMPTTCEHAT